MKTHESIVGEKFSEAGRVDLTNALRDDSFFSENPGMVAILRLKNPFWRCVANRSFSNQCGRSLITQAQTLHLFDKVFSIRSCNAIIDT